MTDRKQCSKCLSMLISGPHFYSDGYVLYGLQRKNFNTSFGKAIPALAYVCMNCGFVELYTTDDGIKKLKEHAKRK